MNKFIHSAFPFIVLLILFVFAGTDAFAFGGPPCDPSPSCTVNCCVATPLDGGLSALLIAGFAYGVKMVRGKFKA